MQLRNFNEIIGVLTDTKFNIKQQFVTLEFTCKKYIEIPVDAIDINYLNRLIGKRIGILNNNGTYSIHKYKSEGDL